MKCNHCGKEFAEAGKFCPSCGKPTQTKRRFSPGMVWGIFGGTMMMFTGFSLMIGGPVAALIVSILCTLFILPPAIVLSIIASKK